MDKNTLSIFGWVMATVIVLMIITSKIDIYNHTLEDNSYDMADTLMDKAMIVDLPKKGTSLNDCSWAEIQAVCDSGCAQEYFKIHDTKKCIIKNGETDEEVTFEIVGFNYDDISCSNKKASITFATQSPIDKKYQFNEVDSNESGWTYANIYDDLNSEDNPQSIYNSLPMNLRNVITTVYKTTSAGNGNDKIVTYSSKLFLFSEEELFGKEIYGYDEKQQQYDGFTQDIYVNKNCDYWLRSPAKNNDTSYCFVDSSGNRGVKSASSNMNLLFGFCIK